MSEADAGLIALNARVRELERQNFELRATNELLRTEVRRLEQRVIIFEAMLREKR